MWKKSLALVTAALMAGSVVQPAFAQYYGDYGGRDDAYGQPPPGGEYGPPPGEGYGPPPPPADYGYRHDYRPTEDPYYRDCQRQRANNTAGGLIIGALAGGLFGNAVSGYRSRGAGTALGAIAGGAVGAGIGNNLSCQDRDYAYRAYYRGLENGRPHSRYDWDNPRTGVHGYLEVNDYYRDRDGFRCADYTQTVIVHGRPESSNGHACQQPDGNWAFIG